MHGSGFQMCLPAKKYIYLHSTHENGYLIT